MAGSKRSRKPNSPGASKATATAHAPPSPRQVSLPNALDGNRDPSESRGRSGSMSGSTSSQTRARPAVLNRNIDIGFRGASLMAGYNAPTDLPPRPSAPNRSGKVIPVKLNTWDITRFPTRSVYQYDVVVDNNSDNKGLIKAVWNSEEVKTTFGQFCIFDGHKLAWTGEDMQQRSTKVDLNKKKNGTLQIDPLTRKPKPDEHQVTLKQTARVDFAQLHAYLQRKADLDGGVLEAFHFLDHLLREEPSQKYYKIGRNFFAPNQENYVLGNGIIAYKGVHEAIRTVLGKQGPCLSINVDVANSAFWIPNQLCRAIMQFLNVRSVNDLQRLSQPDFDKLKALRLTRVAFLKTLPTESANFNDPSLYKGAKEFTVKRISSKTARTHTFKHDGKKINVNQHFQNVHNIRLNYPDLPLVETAKQDVYYPMECLFIKPFQRFSHKLNENQTRSMLQFAVTIPDKRWGDIEKCRSYLNWGQDRYFAKYGFDVGNAAAVVDACVLPNPKVQFGSNSQDNPTDPRTSGRWDLRGKSFLETNKVPLKSWGVVVVPGRQAPDKAAVSNFMQKLAEAYIRYGGKIENKNPVIMEGNADPGLCVEELWNTVGRRFQSDPQLLLFIVHTSNAAFYQKVKRSCDCRYGVASQVVQAKHVIEAKPQYCSNVCLKVNAKLGGVTAQAIGPKSGGNFFSCPTMIIGADVTHASLVHDRQISVAAMTVSYDRKAIRYIANSQGNGVRREIMEQSVIEDLLEKMYKHWCKDVANGQHPKHVFYFRDGVAESQFQQVLDVEVKAMRSLFALWGGNPLLTVIVATKRHHVRFFPQHGSGDRNKNPLPGTLVESGVTHPFEYDFYLNSHVAIKGTARPVHYSVLLDEVKMEKNKLQAMIYESSYQYVRSTTPVSLYPAVYYAHLAAYRGASHQKEDPDKDQQVKAKETKREDLPRERTHDLCTSRGLQARMWFT